MSLPSGSFRRLVDSCSVDPSCDISVVAVAVFIWSGVEVVGGGGADIGRCKMFFMKSKAAKLLTTVRKLMIKHQQTWYFIGNDGEMPT